MSAVTRSTGVAITNPLVLYRALLATKRIDADPAQHRLALHLQTLYERLKDYEPAVEYGHRLSELSKTLASTPSTGTSKDAAPRTVSQTGVLAALFEKKQKDSVSLTRVLTSHEEAVQMQSPRGLMLHGEVGTGDMLGSISPIICSSLRRKVNAH